MVQPISPLHDSTHVADLMDTSGTDDAQQAAIPNVSSMQEASIQSISPAPSAGLNPFHNVRIFLDVCSGRTRPLSTALKHCNVDVLSFDILLDPQMNLLDDTVFLQLLKLCASGVVAYGAFSPSCGEYSRLKLRPGGPPPLRDPDHIDGLPGLDCHSTMKLQNSFTMLDRCCQCLIALYSSGGHGHLEQPPTAMSWQEPSVQQWLLTSGASCIHLAACAFGRNWNKSWMFASSLRSLQSMACVCTHPKASHENIGGVLDATGQFLSRQTAEYPVELANQFAQITLPLFSATQQDIKWDERKRILPVKGLIDPPRSSQDGGGVHSLPDWSAPHHKPDVFSEVRRSWMKHIISNKWHLRLIAHLDQHINSPIFTPSEVQQFRESLEQLVTSHGLAADWAIPADQPLNLRFLQNLSILCGDPDNQLFDHLISGVPTGYHGDIPISHCFPTTTIDDSPHDPLSVHLASWQSALDDPSVTSTLVQEEVDNHWVDRFDGDLASAQAHFNGDISIGRLGVATSDSRPPRLVVDLSVGGLNQNCVIPERSTLPSSKDIMRCFPLRNSTDDQLGLSIDIKSAHKRIAIRPSERGLVGFSWQNELYFYRVCPFGATFSAHWWSRLGGVILRLCHQLIYISHSGQLYVDDFIFSQSATVLPATACLLFLFFQAMNIPISWRKCELSHSINWIGWRFNFTSGIITIPVEKISKLRKLILSLKNHKRVPLKILQKFVGLAMWITQLFPNMRIWLHYFYIDMHSVPATQFSVDPGNWHDFLQCLSENLTFERQPSNTAIPIGGKLVEIRHHKVTSISDVRAIGVSERRLWLRIRDPSSSRRVLSESSSRMLKVFLRWIEGLSPIRSMWPKSIMAAYAAADACAHGTHAQIGGFIKIDDSNTIWFSESFSPKDFLSKNIPMNDNAQRDITCYETLAQLAILKLAGSLYPSCRFPIRIASLSDNTGAEAGSNCLFSTKQPMCFFLEKICILSASSGIEIDVSHISGASNDMADMISRWDEKSHPTPPCQLSSDHRIRFPLEVLWETQHPVSLHPSSAFIPWQLPSIPMV